MALLTTPAYNPWNPAPWVGDTIQLGLRIRQQREQDAAHQQQIQAQQQQQAAADQRRAFEFNRSLEFKRAADAADNARLDRNQAFQQQQTAAQNAPFSMPSGGASSTPQSYGIPALPSQGATSPVETPVAAPTDAPDGVTVPEAATASPMDVEGASAAPEQPSGGVVDSSDDEGATEFVKGLEGFTPHAYNDNKQISIGYGTRAKPGEKEISPEEGVDRLRQELGQSVMRVNDARYKYGIPELSKNQFNALTSFDYNTGAINELLSTRKTPEAILSGLAEYTKETKNGKKVFSQGIWNRRQKEIALFASGGQQAAPAADDPVASYAQQMQANGVPNKYAIPSLVRVAEANAKQKPPNGQFKTYEEAAGDAQYDPESKMLQRSDGSQFFVDQTSKGFVQRAFKPSQKAATLKTGDDGQIYPFDSQGKPLKPLPEGIRFDKFNPKLVTKTVPGVGLVKVEPDGSTAVLIPQGASVPASVSKSYLEASQDLRTAQVDLDAQTKLLAERPRGVTDWFGGSESSVESAQKKFNDAKAKVEGIRSDFPQLMPKGTAAAPAQAVSQSATPAAPSGSPRSSLGSFQTEAEARGSGAKTGDIVMVVNPKTGKPQKARLD